MAKKRLTRLRPATGGASARQEFPQISRIFTAPFLKTGAKTLVLGIFTAFLIINLFPILPDDFLSLMQAKVAVMLSPNDLSSHLILAREYLKRGGMEEVERELLLAQELAGRNKEATNYSVLGTSLSPLEISAKLRSEPQRIRDEIAFWEKIIAEKPDYRDAYLQLSILNYQIYENEKAKIYLKKVLYLDPNFESAKKLEKILGN